MDLDLGAVESFVVVAELRHYGRAAERLGVSVSALTKRIQRLESACGVPLVLRDSGGVLGLSPAGQRLMQVAPSLLERARSALRVAADEPTTTLRLAVPAGVGVVAPLLPTAIATLELALRHSHPGVAVTEVPTAFPRLTRDLVDGDVDVVLTFGSSPRDDVRSTRLSQIHRVGLVGARHPFARRRLLDVEEFARAPMIHAPDLPAEYMDPFVLADVRPLGVADLVPIRAETTAHVAQRVLQGREVTVVPVALTANLPPELVRVGLRGVPATWYVAQRRRDDDRPELATAVELMADFTESMSRAALAVS